MSDEARLDAPPATPSRAKRWLCPAIIALCFVAWAAGFIAKTSHDVDGVRWFCLFDDAMISMRYAKNLVDGHGLTWNPGEERVEGFTNLLWTLWMAACHLAPVGIEKVSLLIQLSGLALLLANLFVVLAIGRELRGDVPGDGAPLAAMFLLAFYYPVNNWTLQGMEVGAVALCVSLAALTSLRSAKRGDASLAPWWWMGVASLTRLDAFALFLVFIAWRAWADQARWKRHLLVGGAFIAAFLLGQTAFRLWYYGDALPNTYYLKMTGYPAHLRVLRGAAVLWDFLARPNPLLYLFGFAILFFRRDKPVLLLAALVVGQAAYSAYVGGDAWEGYGGSNRFISVAMPLYFVLFGLSMERVLGWARRKMELSEQMLRIAMVGGAALAFYGFNMMDGTTNSLARVYLYENPLFVDPNYANIRDAQLAVDIATPDASLAVNWAGAPAYFTGRRIVDFSGKNDRVLARQEARVEPGWREFRRFVPGHAKWDYARSIGELKPDVIVQIGLMGSQGRAAQKAMAGKYLLMQYDHYGSPQSDWGEKENYFLLRSDSPNIRWKRVNELLEERAREIAGAEAKAKAEGARTEAPTPPPAE